MQIKSGTNDSGNNARSSHTTGDSPADSYERITISPRRNDGGNLNFGNIMSSDSKITQRLGNTVSTTTTRGTVVTQYAGDSQRNPFPPGFPFSAQLQHSSWKSKPREAQTVKQARSTASGREGYGRPRSEDRGGSEHGTTDKAGLSAEDDDSEDAEAGQRTPSSSVISVGGRGGGPRATQSITFHGDVNHSGGNAIFGCELNGSNVTMTSRQSSSSKHTSRGDFR